MNHCAKIHICYSNGANLHNYYSTNVFLQIYTITITQMYFCTMIYRLMWVYFGLIGKIYTIIVAMQMNVLEII